MSAGLIVTRDEGQPGVEYIGFRPAVGILPDGREIRRGYWVTGSYWREDDVCGHVIGWDAETFKVAWDGGSIELGPENILTIEAVR